MRTIELKILCEGPTEQNFVTKVLAPHLKDFNAFCKTSSLAPGTQGGVVSFERLYAGIKNELGRSRAHQYVTTMIDLYKIGDFPEAAKRGAESGLERVRRIERAMAQEMGSGQFVPYIQLHEFEALVLVDVAEIPAQFPDGEADTGLVTLHKSIAGQRPEEIDDGKETAPSKRIIRAIPRYAHRKATAGPSIAGAIGLERLRAACPHFGDWLSRLEKLADT